MNRSYLSGALVAAAAVAGLVVAINPGRTGRTSTAGQGSEPVVSGAASTTQGPLHLTDGYVPQPASPSVAAAYFTVSNSSAQPDTLLGASSNVSSSVGLHDETSSHGVAAMVAISSIPIPAGGSIVLAPGHKHLMIMNPSTTLKAGDTVEITLRFARAGVMTVAMPVVPFSATLGSSDTGGTNVSG